MSENNFLPINKNKIIQELKENGIPIQVINNINWINCIEEGYCIYNDEINNLCLTKIKDKKGYICSVHKKKKKSNIIDNIIDKFKNINIDENKDNYTNLKSGVQDFMYKIIEILKYRDAEYIHLKIINFIKDFINSFDIDISDNIEYLDKISERNSWEIHSCTSNFYKTSYTCEFCRKKYLDSFDDESMHEVK